MLSKSACKTLEKIAPRVDEERSFHFMVGQDKQTEASLKICSSDTNIPQRRRFDLEVKWHREDGMLQDIHLRFSLDSSLHFTNILPQKYERLAFTYNTHDSEVSERLKWPGEGKNIKCVDAADLINEHMEAIGEWLAQERSR